ncbi:MAG: sensor histidine kinase [Thermoleophilia bacterium]
MDGGRASVRGAVARYAIAGLVALAVVAVAGALVLDRVSEDEAVEEARRLATLAGRGVVEPALTDGVLAGDPQALDGLDTVVQERVLSDDVVRVKVWTRDGRIAYSDEPRLIGARYRLGAEEQAAFASGDTEAEVADLSKPENRYERDEGSLLEVYLPIRTPAGEPALFELYRRESAVAASGRDLLVAIAPVLVGGLLLLWLIQLPLAWRGARRLEAGARDRERLLEAALESSAVERRRVAADLHDGPVQSLAGLSYGLAAAAQRAPEGTDPATVDALRDGAEAAREGIRRLRAAVVDINPGRLHDEGLAAALDDLAAPLRARGVEVQVDVPADLVLPEGAEQLLYRAAGEALRNVAAHADAANVAVRVARDDGRARLTVRDDGHGFDADTRARRTEEGHLGLALLEDLAAHLGGRADVRSAPGEGTVVELEVPA